MSFVDSGYTRSHLPFEKNAVAWCGYVENNSSTITGPLLYAYYMDVYANATFV